jgi:hypothetical protein
MIHATVCRFWLRVFTLVYLSFPLLIFFIGWLRPLYSVALVVIVTVALARYCLLESRREQRSGCQGGLLSISRLAVSLLPIVALTYVSGAGGWGFQESDWWKHKAILKDLIERPWPVAYDTPQDTVMLVYYLAYYLPAAAIGKVGGWFGANQALFITTLLGVSAGSLWIALLTRGAALWKTAAFGLFSGMDVIGFVLRSLSQDYIPWTRRIASLSLEWWGDWWQYSSNATLLFWVPQHAIAGWLTAALILDAHERDDHEVPWMFVLGLSLLWSPFVTVGLLPFVLSLLARRPGKLRERLLSTATVTNLCGAIVVAVLGCYYWSRFLPYSLGPTVDTEIHSALSKGSFAFLPLLERRNRLDFFVIYSLFCTLEFLGLCLVIFLALPPSDRAGTTCLIPATATLLILPLFRYGFYNDLVMRASIPGLFIIGALAIRALADWRRKPKVALLILVFLSVGSVTSLKQIERYINKSTSLFHLERSDELDGLMTLLAKRPVYTPQYVGSANSPFFRHLAKPGSTRPLGTVTSLAAPIPGSD